MKVLDWGEDGMVTAAEAAALRASFQQEVAVWHKLDHPNITKVRHSILYKFSFVDLSIWLIYGESNDNYFLWLKNYDNTSKDREYCC